MTLRRREVHGRQFGTGFQKSAKVTASLKEPLSSSSKAIALLFGTAVLLGVIALFVPPIAQPLAYHHFADQRGWLGIANFGDVVSNLPFAIFGLWGLYFLFSLTPAERSRRFADSREQWPYAVVFLGLVLTAVGSSYYHLAPDNARLVWDRLPITVDFTAMVAAVICERVSVKAGLWLLPAFLALGIVSVLQWNWSEIHGHGDLRFYAAVQIYSGLVLLLALLLPPSYTRGRDFGVIVAFYVLAKILETADPQVFALGHIVSGHTLKHLAAAMAGYWILRMLMKREILSARSA